MSIKNHEKDVQLSLESIQKQVVKYIKSHGLNKQGDHPIQQIGQKLLLASSSIT